MANRPAESAPTVVWLGRIDPLKDLETLIQAASIVHGAMPQVRFVLYGQAPKGNEWYFQCCEALRDQLALGMWSSSADSLRARPLRTTRATLPCCRVSLRGFPYSVVEAMMCGRTVVGTDVGGVGEALEGCGLVVEPRNPQQLAEACLMLLPIRCYAGTWAKRPEQGPSSDLACSSAIRLTWLSFSIWRRLSTHADRWLQTRPLVEWKNLTESLSRLLCVKRWLQERCHERRG